MSIDNDENMSPRERTKAALEMYRQLHKNDASMTDTMTEADCQRVQEWLGGCWHENLSRMYKDMFYSVTFRYCRKCKKVHGNRTFKTDKDLLDCFRKLVDTGQWRHLCDVFFCTYEEDAEIIDGCYDEALWIQWLFSPLPSGHWRLVWLVSEAVEGGIIK